MLIASDLTTYDSIIPLFAPNKFDALVNIGTIWRIVKLGIDTQKPIFRLNLRY
jgi:hypothetical protein